MNAANSGVRSPYLFYTVAVCTGNCIREFFCLKSSKMLDMLCFFVNTVATRSQYGCVFWRLLEIDLLQCGDWSLNSDYAIMSRAMFYSTIHCTSSLEYVCWCSPNQSLSWVYRPINITDIVRLSSLAALYFCPVSFFLFFLALSQRLQIGCLPYFSFYTWCGPSANLECRSKMYCTRLAGNAGPKNSPSGHHRTTLSGYIFATKAIVDNRKKTC